MYLQNHCVSVDWNPSHTDVLDNAVDTALKEVPLDDISVQRLKESNYVFSGIKTFHELNETFPSLLDEEGNRKPFNQFLNDVQKVYDTYNVQYLRTEYNFAQASALMAARWKKFEQDGDRYNLQYRTMYDKRVRRTHRMLHNITRPSKVRSGTNISRPTVGIAAVPWCRYARTNTP